MSLGNLTPSNYVTDGKYKFKLEWNGKTVASSSINKEVTWTQTSWLTDSTTHSNIGFEEIGNSGFATGDSGNGFWGLGNSSNSNDQCVIDGNGSTTNWWHCVGAVETHTHNSSTGIPGPLQKIASSMYLYIWSPSNL